MYANDSSTQANQTNSPLLRLPAKLRYKIYAYASDTVIIMNKNNQRRESNSRAVLLAVCRQIHNEATPEMETSRVLRLRDYIDPQDLTDQLGVTRTFELRTIEMHISFLLRLKDQIHTEKTTGKMVGWCDWHKFVNVRGVKLWRDAEDGCYPVVRLKRHEARDVLTTIFYHQKVKVVYP